MDCWAPVGGPTCPPLARVLFEHGDGVTQVVEDDAVVVLRAGLHGGQWDTLPLGDQVAFGARLALIDGIGSHRIAPLLAGTLVLFRIDRAQSTRSASPS